MVRRIRDPLDAIEDFDHLVALLLEVEFAEASPRRFVALSAVVEHFLAGVRGTSLDLGVLDALLRTLEIPTG